MAFYFTKRRYLNIFLFLKQSHVKKSKENNCGSNYKSCNMLRSQSFRRIFFLYYGGLPISTQQCNWFCYGEIQSHQKDHNQRWLRKTYKQRCLSWMVMHKNWIITIYVNFKNSLLKICFSEFFFKFYHMRALLCKNEFWTWQEETTYCMFLIL